MCVEHPLPDRLVFALHIQCKDHGGCTECFVPSCFRSLPAADLTDPACHGIERNQGRRSTHQVDGQDTITRIVLDTDNKKAPVLAGAFCILRCLILQTQCFLGTISSSVNSVASLVLSSVNSLISLVNNSVLSILSSVNSSISSAIDSVTCSVNSLTCQ